MWFTPCKKWRNQYRKKGDKTKRMKAIRSPVISDLYLQRNTYPPWNVSFIHSVGTGNHLNMLLSLSFFLREGSRKVTELSFDFETEMPKRHEERRHANGRREEERKGVGAGGRQMRELDGKKREGSCGCSPRLYLRPYFRPSFYKTMVSTET